MTAQTAFRQDVALAETVAATPSLIRRILGEQRTRFVQIHLPAPGASARAALFALPGDTPFLWAPPEQDAVAARGAVTTLTVTPQGPDLKTQAAALQIDAHAVHGVQPRAPIFVGGLAFDPHRQSDEWKQFGAGSFVLPRWTYVSSHGQPSLLLAVAPHEHDAETFIAEYENFLSRLGAPFVPNDAGPLDIQNESQARWSGRVEAILACLKEGRASKIVAARRTELRAHVDIDLKSIIERFAAVEKNAIRFACGRKDGVFVGAAPERLVKKCGQRVESEAVAGSIDADADVSALKSSSKDLAEHAYVARFIFDRLRPRTKRLQMPDRPQTRRMRDVAHLRTPIAGELHENVHVLDLVEDLHPTPAVCGIPTETARRMIADGEPDRGWYAGPIGWFDAQGDGAFAVALRCALVRGPHAYIYTGAGIVEGSDATAEYEETALKQKSFLRALGL